jgi:hypothetical protein
MHALVELDLFEQRASGAERGAGARDEIRGDRVVAAP